MRLHSRFVTVGLGSVFVLTSASLVLHASSRILEASHARPTQQHAAAGPGELVFENRLVRVYRLHLEPHQHIPMHSLGARLVIWLTDVHLRDTLSTGKIEEVAQKTGDVTWVPAQRHAGVNLSDGPVAFVAVEIK